MMLTNETITLKTARLILRPPTLDDFDAFYSWGSNPQNVRYMAWGPNDEQQTKAFLASAQIGKDFAVVLKDCSTVIGSCGIYPDSANDTGELGWILHKDYWQHGYGTELAAELIRYGFEDLKLRRISAPCAAVNYGSYRIMERNGMRREALHRKAFWARVDQEWIDEARYAILAEDYFARPALFTIRPEHRGDYKAILRLTYQAFLTSDYPGRRRVDEHYLIHLLQGSPFVIPELCFVVEQDGDIVGHILYSKSEILRPDGSLINTTTFGPLSVLPQRQQQGIGAALVRHSMEKAREMGLGAVMITGVPDYYPKLGFKRAHDYGLTLPDSSSPDAFMAYELQPGYLSGGGTLRFLSPEFEQSENGDSGFEEFHKQFMVEHYPAQLTLRPLFDNDIALMERWLYAPHVARWYKHPDHWLNELRERRGEFSFLRHFIAEFEGLPIGFCQYYDCFYAQKHEVWNDQWRVGDGQGKIFSIDYLIGEQDYLHRGFGQEIIAQMLDMLRKTGANTVIVEPERDNSASNRALEANGFIWNGADYHLELWSAET